MKKILIFLISFMFMTGTYCQDSLNRVDANGKKQGKWIKKDKDGAKVYEGQFVNGVPTGTFRYFYPGGGVKAVSEFFDKGRRTKTVTYFPNGKKMSEGFFFNEKRDSLWKFFSDYDEALVSVESYRNGLKNGVSTTYYAGKGPAEVITWKDGVKEGPWEEYYAEGALKVKGHYRNDLRDGSFNTYYSSGKILYSGQYKDGDPVGIWSYYDEKGRVEKKETYFKGFLFKTDSIK